MRDVFCDAISIKIIDYTHIFWPWELTQELRDMMDFKDLSQSAASDWGPMTRIMSILGQTTKVTKIAFAQILIQFLSG